MKLKYKKDCVRIISLEILKQVKFYYSNKNTFSHKNKNPYDLQGYKDKSKAITVVIQINNSEEGQAE